jgi:hypothetical protein
VEDAAGVDRGFAAFAAVLYFSVCHFHVAREMAHKGLVSTTLPQADYACSAV